MQKGQTGEEDYKNFRTFEDVCRHGAMYVSDQVKNHPNWLDVPDDSKVLYEMVGEYEWIGKIIYDYNCLGFFTDLSQPGLSEDNYRQRACIRGHMYKDRAIKIYDELIKNKNFCVYASCIEPENYPLEFSVMTLGFKDGQPIYKESASFSDVESTSFSDVCPGTFKYMFQKKFINLNPKLFEDDVITCFTIMDKRWDDNSELWSNLLDALKKFP
jgi:hypothetical protein